MYLRCINIVRSLTEKWKALVEEIQGSYCLNIKVKKKDHPQEKEMQKGFHSNP